MEAKFFPEFEPILVNVVNEMKYADIDDGFRY